MLLLPVIVLFELACGASINAVYEGDVRFEHCMALDSRPGVKPTIHKACWAEWLKFYTFGQTRDRVDYAKLRIRQLNAASDFLESEVPELPKAAAAVPEPTSALAPPPMLFSMDAGLGDDAAMDAPEEAAVLAVALPGVECADECKQKWTSCNEDCKPATGCEKGCTTKYRRCMRKCF